MGFKISDYPSKTVFNDTDLMDVSTAGTTSESMTYAQLKTNLNANLSFLSSVPSGVCGIADASGVYTYYSTLQDAINAGSSTDTITLFADITETTNITVTLKAGQKINLNGHTYKLDQVGSANAFTINTVGDFHIYNGNIERVNGTASTSNNFAVYVNNTSANLIGDFIVKNPNGVGVKIDGGDVSGIRSYCFWPGIILNNTSAQLNNCESYATNSYGLWVLNGTARNCYGFSSGNDGIRSTDKLENCYGYSESTYGLFGGTESYNCFGRSDADVGYHAKDSSINTNCTGVGVGSGYEADAGSKNIDFKGISSGYLGVEGLSSGTTETIYVNGYAESFLNIAFYAISNSTGDVKVINTTCKCNEDNSTGHALYLTGSNPNFIAQNNNLEVKNAGANGIFSDTVGGIYALGNVINVTPTTPINIVANKMTNTPDSYNNIQIG